MIKFKPLNSGTSTRDKAIKNDTKLDLKDLNLRSVDYYY